MSKKRKQLLDKVSVPPQIQTTIFNTSLAEETQLTFSFMYLDLKRGRFKVSSGKGESMLEVFTILKRNSNYKQKEVFGPKNNHYINRKLIKKFNLEDLADMSSNGRLFQLGRTRKPERVVGFFDSNSPNLFQVCFLDLKHLLHRM